MQTPRGVPTVLRWHPLSRLEPDLLTYSVNETVVDLAVITARLADCESQIAQLCIYKLHCILKGVVAWV